jgi:hypothetical protein
VKFWNVEPDPDAIGKFIALNASTLKEFTLRFWSCKHTMPGRRAIDPLLEHAGRKKVLELLYVFSLNSVPKSIVHN